MKNYVPPPTRVPVEHNYMAIDAPDPYPDPFVETPKKKNLEVPWGMVESMLVVAVTVAVAFIFVLSVFY
jgi:hypothetical protein